MTYSPQTWQDRIVQYPLTYTQTVNGDGTITLTPAPGTITQAGTPVNATRLTNMELGIAAALPAAGGAVTGPITYQGEELPMLRKNSTTGVLEYYDGTGWNPVGAITMAASNTVRKLDATEYSGPHAGSNASPVLLAKIIPPATGEMVVTFDAKSTAGTGAGVYFASTFGGANDVTSYINTSTGIWSGLDFRTPLGTQISGLATSSTGISAAQVGSLATSYATYTTVLSVMRQSPIYLLVGGTGAGTGYLKNLALKYDLIKGG